MSINYNKGKETGQKITAQTSPFLSLLAVLFIGLKLTHYISWSWWLVLLPLYGPIVFWLAIVFICLLILGLAKLLE